MQLTWLNSAPLTLRQLRGKVVLLDFWTYSCVNCIRTFPHLKEWHEKYKDKGLVIIGIHTPEFEFEKQEENVQKALEKNGIEYPVVLDNDYKIWNLYANRWWPRKFLLDSQGTIVYDHVGEGGYGETEQAIQRELTNIGAKQLPEIPVDTSLAGGICYPTTPETYLGYLRGRFGNTNAFTPDEEHDFVAPEQREDDTVYLHGHWTLSDDHLAHTRALPSATEYFSLRYSAFSVNLVMGNTNGKPAKVEIELDGQPIAEDMQGKDVVTENGKSFIDVSEQRMYRLINAKTHHRGNIKIKTAAGNIAFYAFTFGGCEEK